MILKKWKKGIASLMSCMLMWSGNFSVYAENIVFTETEAEIKSGIEEGEEFSEEYNNIDMGEIMEAESDTNVGVAEDGQEEIITTMEDEGFDSGVVENEGIFEIFDPELEYEQKEPEVILGDGEETEVISENTESKSEIDSIHYEEVFVNPGCSDVYLGASEGLSEMFELAESEKRYYTSVEEAGTELREKMKNRAEIITIYYETQDEDYEKLLRKISDEALKNTANPVEGDYLRYQFAGWHGNVDGYGNIETDYDGTTYKLKLTYSMVYFSSAEQEIAVDQAIAEVLGSMDLENKNAFQKILCIYNYICGNIEYDTAGAENFDNPIAATAYGALINKRAVCQGYSVLLYRMLKEAGIEGRIIDGIAGEEGHSWNIVKLEDRFYNLDSTWDAGFIEYSYFLRGKDSFGNHISGERFQESEFIENYPISQEAYEIDDNQVYREGDYIFTIGLQGLTLQEYIGTDEEIIVPQFINGYPVYQIKKDAFTIQFAKSIVISEGIRLIQDGAIFGGEIGNLSLPASICIGDTGGNGDGIYTGTTYMFPCTLHSVSVAENSKYLMVYDGGLYSKNGEVLYGYPSGRTDEHVTVFEGTKVICDSAFCNNPYIKSVSLPDGLETIGYFAFIQVSNLQNINIPEKCSFIGQEAFALTALKEIYIPASVYIMGNNPFRETPLETLTVDPANPVYRSKEGALYKGTELIYYPIGKINNTIAVPEGTTKIGDAAFFGAKNLVQIELNEDLEEIGWEAFGCCDLLKNIRIPSGVETIREDAFRHCSSLEKIEVDFKSKYYSSVDGILYNAEKTQIVVFPPMIGGDIVIPDTITSLPENVFEENKYLTSVVLPESLTRISSGMFMNCKNLNSVTLGNNIQIIGDDAFAGCEKLKRMDLPASVKAIGNYAFNWCCEMEQINIPANVTEIGENAFSYCKKLKQISVDAHNLKFSFQDGILFDKEKTCVLKCLQTVEGLVYLPDSVQRIEQRAFEFCENITGILFGDKVSDIGESAFWGCTKLEQLKIPENISIINVGTFVGCELPCITVPRNVREIRRWAFDGSNCQKIIILNPECYIYDEENTISSCSKIYGYTGSTAEKYATKYNSEFISIDGHDKGVHQWNSEYTIDKEANCIETGEKSIHCNVCDQIKDGSVVEIAAMGHTWIFGKIIQEPTCTKTGTIEDTCTLCKETRQETLDVLEHQWGKWTNVSKATVLAPEKQKRACSICGTEETKFVGNKITPTIKVNFTSLTLKVGQSTNAVKVSGLAYGDSVKSWKSSNATIVKVDSEGKIVAQKKTGKAIITVTLVSKKTANITVTVQKSAVKTKKITGLKTKFTLKKGQKVNLKPVRNPITATEKIVYTSSNKKIVTVTSSGVVQARAAGNAKITVKSGSAKFVITISVPKVKTTSISNIKKTLTIKKGRTYTLKPKISPSNSDEKITYTSSDKKVVTVSSKGVIKGVSRGKTVVTVKSGSKIVKCTVTVK